MYCLFNLSKRFSLSQHNAIASVVRRSLVSTNVFIFPSFSAFFVRLRFGGGGPYSHFRIFLAFHLCAPGGPRWVRQLMTGGAFGARPKAFVLNHIANDAHKAFNLLSLSNCMNANILLPVRRSQ